MSATPPGSNPDPNRAFISKKNHHYAPPKPEFLASHAANAPADKYPFFNVKRGTALQMGVFTGISIACLWAYSRIMAPDAVHDARHSWRALTQKVDKTKENPRPMGTRGLENTMR
jgi:hypothetical protein